MPKAQYMTALKAMPAGTPVASVTPAGEASRLSLRGDDNAATEISKALGVSLPLSPLASATNGTRTALWLGPDEWLVIDETAADMMDALSSVKELHSAVDISHRNTAVIVKGPQASDAINAGCPLNLSLATFPVGKCARTVLGKVEIVLWRKAEDEFRVECWRSFAPYVFGMLKEGALDVAG